MLPPRKYDGTSSSVTAMSLLVVVTLEKAANSPVSALYHIVSAGKVTFLVD